MPLILVCALFLLPFGASADTLELTGLQTGFVMGGVYTSPYLISVNGQLTLMMACDDFTTDIYIGYSWQANEVAISAVGTTNSGAGPQKFPQESAYIPGVTGPQTYTIQQEYNAAAYLAEQLLSVPSVLTNSELAGEYSFAIWQIFYLGAINGYGGHALTSTEAAEVGSLMTTAFSNALVRDFPPQQDGPLKSELHR